jgi:hypothetical protein
VFTAVNKSTPILTFWRWAYRIVLFCILVAPSPIRILRCGLTWRLSLLRRIEIKIFHYFRSTMSVASAVVASSPELVTPAPQPKNNKRGRGRPPKVEDSPVGELPKVEKSQPPPVELKVEEPTWKEEVDFQVQKTQEPILVPSPEIKKEKDIPHPRNLPGDSVQIGNPIARLPGDSIQIGNPIAGPTISFGESTKDDDLSASVQAVPDGEIPTYTREDFEALRNTNADLRLFGQNISLGALAMSAMSYIFFRFW